MRQLVIGSETLSNITIFLSIAFGFYITSLSIFVASKFITSLHKYESKKNPGITLMYELLGRYKEGLILNLFSIVIFILLSFIIDQSQLRRIEFFEPISFLILPLLVGNVIYFYILLRDLINVVIQEAKFNVSSITTES